MKKTFLYILTFAVVLLIPRITYADTVAGSIDGLQSVLDDLYQQMLPKCSTLIGYGRAIAGFAAIWYIGYRVWGHIARAEPIDFYPLMRPFAINLVIILYPAMLAGFNGLFSPLVSVTKDMVNSSNKSIEVLLKQKEDEQKKTAEWKMLVGPGENGNRELWMQYTHPGQEEGMLDKIGNNIQFTLEKMSYNFSNYIKYVISVILQIIYSAAALCINTLRTFNLLIMAILGPLVLGLSVFDGFHHTLPVFLSRYIHYFMWLPVCNILGGLLGTIQENILKMDIESIKATGTTFFSSHDVGYIVFMLIGIVSYFSVPSIAEYIVSANGGAGFSQRVSGVAGATMKSVTGKII